MTLKKDNKSPIIASSLKPKSPQPIIIAPMTAIPINTIDDLKTRSLYRRKLPIIAMTGCNVKIIVELATVVSFKDSNQRAKCIAKKKPEKNKNPQPCLVIFLNSWRRTHTNGEMSMLAISILYILMIVAGASDHLTNIAENDMKIIAMIMDKLNDLFSIIITFFY